MLCGAWKGSELMGKREDCIFCKIVAGEVPCCKVFEDDRALAFMDIMPLNKGHLLVVPKDHYENIFEIDDGLYGHLMSLISRIAKAVKMTVEPDGMNILQLNGRAANQVVPHLHIHIVPRWTGDSLTVSSWEPVPGNMGEISAVGDLIKERLSPT
jgi:histidine triad (HIT) family protein